MQEEHYKNLSLEDIQGEIWKDIPDYIGLYQASNFGRIKSLARMSALRSPNNKKSNSYTINEKILKQILFKNGYLSVNLNNDGTKKMYVHRIIAEAFISNPESKKEIDHIDTKRNNNNISNLRWVTRAENCRNETTRIKMSNTFKEKSKTDEYKEHLNKMRKSGFTKEAISKRVKPVIQYDKLGNYINEYESISDATRKTGISTSGICNCCKKKKEMCGGYIWEYKSK